MTMKSQSAMEYLMTYGWAILVIAVVLAALYSLGIFNPNSFAPKASAGSCEVVRPFGPTTSTDIHSTGTCTNMLPKYVASFNGNGQISVLMPTLSHSITYTAWVNFASLAQSNYGDTGQIIGWEPGYGPSLLFLQPSIYQFEFSVWYANTQQEAVLSGTTPKLNTWYFMAGTYNESSGLIQVYVNNKVYNQTISKETLETGNVLTIGAWPSQLSYFKGELANVQIYNNSISSNQISALYQEGIGGDPIDLTNLVGWWPLNGNANDYSGNNYNGKETNVAYSSTWYRTYSAP